MKTDRNLCLRTGTKPRNPHPKTTHLQATQFAKGRSGNPGGRPKGLILLSEATLAWLAEADPKTGMTNAMLVTLALGKKALAGDVVAARELADRSEGRPAQAMQHEVIRPVKIQVDGLMQAIREIYGLKDFTSTEDRLIDRPKEFLS
ncbi:MAG: hypothetical protein DMG88_02840 [Acidobacteria bacterium]|nr:MAG: hypothetical protein DMG88_02840 [Acidobacteriota bacterium]